MYLSHRKLGNSNIMLSEMNQSEEDRNDMFHLHKVSQVFKFTYTKTGYCGVLGGEGNGVFFLNGYRFLVLVMKKFQRSVLQREYIFHLNCTQAFG